MPVAGAVEVVDVGVPVAIRLTGKSLGEGVEAGIVPDDHAAFGFRPPEGPEVGPFLHSLRQPVRA
ncbi:hypothetical protein GCM10018980_19090 [Streptomyces capoamus]|uniref:Uncharacterized protein n=1 Tax=Streptomyces capoamus TaxID=68183 RepID=A0A919EWB3_9ACTN|nr:hypothetical protein GCM10010501_32680 [Streptomyces libani subsp. rufus]GHG42820.1 hypothetical protein GCM10018980_19090 [Streptomyces capoamus]